MSIDMGKKGLGAAAVGAAVGLLLVAAGFDLAGVVDGVGAVPLGAPDPGPEVGATEGPLLVASAGGCKTDFPTGRMPVGLSNRGNAGMPGLAEGSGVPEGSGPCAVASAR